MGTSELTALIDKALAEVSGAATTDVPTTTVAAP
jgi:hypothetical protein